MKIKNTPPRPGLPTRIKDRLVIRWDPRFGPVVQSWPRKNVGGKPRGDPAKVALWDMAIQWTKSPEPSEYNQALTDTQGTAFYARDILISSIYGNYVSWPGWGWKVQMAQNIQAMLDSITSEPGAILYRAESGWLGLSPGTTAQVLTISALGNFPEWADIPPTAIDQLTGDVLAGPGSGSQAATLSTTGVTAGSYTLASITVDAKGRVTAASNGSVSTGINQLTGDVTAGPGSGSQAATLANTTVTPGTYTLATVTVDSKGRVTSAASNGGTPIPPTSGTWTPTDASGAGLTLTVTDAYYIQAGALIFIWARITFPVTSNANRIAIGGLPANCKTVTQRINVGQANQTGTFSASFSAGTEDRINFQNGATFFNNNNWSNTTFTVSAIYPIA